MMTDLGTFARAGRAEAPAHVWSRFPKRPLRLSFTGHYIILSFMSQNYEMSRKKELSLWDWGL